MSDLLKQWPDYFGLCADMTFKNLRRKHYPLFPQNKLRDTVNFSRAVERYGPLSLSRWMGHIAYEATAFSEPLLMQGAALTDCLEEVFRQPQWDTLTLSRLSEAQAATLRENSQVRKWHFVEREQKIWGICPANHGDFKTWLASRGFKFRKNFRHIRNQSEKDGFRITEELSMPDLVQVYKARRMIKGEDDYSLHPHFLGFLEELIAALRAEGRLYLKGLKLGDQTIGFCLAFRFENDLHVYQLAYDPGYAKISPGKLLLVGLIEENFDKGYRLIDFMSEFDYVGHFTDDAFHYRHFLLYSKSWKGRLLAWAKQVYG